MKTWLYLTGFVVFIVLIGWAFSYIYGSPLILYIAVIFSIAMSFSSYWFSDKIVVALAHAKPIEKRDAPELYRIVENLTIAAGLPMPRVYIIHEMQANAFATGRDPKHAVVAVTRGLLERLDRKELEGVLAHELSHIGNRDMLVSTVAAVLVGFVAILSDFFLRSLFWGSFGGRRSRHGGNAGGILLLVGIALAILTPIAASLIRLAISRKREFLADASGALLTRYPEGLAAALEKIAQDPTPMRSAHNATAHLYLDNPFKGKQRRGFFTRLFMTHPPIEERIRILRKMNV